MQHKETVLIYEEDGSTEETRWDLSAYVDLDEAEMFDALGYSHTFDLGDDGILCCSVYKKRDEDKWVFSVFDYGIRILLVLVEEPLAFTRYLKEISEACLAAHQANMIFEQNTP